MPRRISWVYSPPVTITVFPFRFDVSTSFLQSTGAEHLYPSIFLFVLCSDANIPGFVEANSNLEIRRLKSRRDEKNWCPNRRRNSQIYTISQYVFRRHRHRPHVLCCLISENDAACLSCLTPFLLASSRFRELGSLFVVFLAHVSFPLQSRQWS